MAETTSNEVAAILDDIRKQIAALSERLARLEQGQVAAAAPAPAPAQASDSAPLPAPEAPPPPPPEPDRISEEELIAISAALGAYLGVRVHIRQVRLISSRAWAQEGRVSIQASHRL